MTNRPQILSGGGKISRQFSELRNRSEVVKNNLSTDVFVSTTTRGTFITPKRKQSGLKSGSRSAGARWL